MDEMETCSWCTNEVRADELVEVDNGNICTVCHFEALLAGDIK